MKKIFAGIILLLLGFSSVNAQQKIILKLADKAFSEFAWNEAIDLYTSAYAKDSNNVWIIRQLAKANTNIMKTDETERWYRKLIDMEQYVPDDYFEYALSLKSNGKYKEAVKALEEYAEMKPDDGRIAMQQSLLEYINFLIQDSVRFRVNALPFNTKGSDWGPTIFGNKLVFASTGDPDMTRDPKYNWDQLPFLDLYHVTIDEKGNYSKPSIFAKNLMSSSHDGPAAFDVTETKMYYNSSRQRASFKQDKQTNQQLYVAELVDGEWVDRGPFLHNNPEHNFKHPSIDSAGQTLFFASDMPGGKGGHDIYYCQKVNGVWGSPINLAEVNTEGEDQFPFIAPDSCLYFASNGHAGMGGLDLYLAIPENGYYTDIEPLGFPVNTSKDDFGLWIDEIGFDGYFSSDRSGGKGFDDVYKLKILWIPVVIKGTVHDRINSFEIPGAQVVLMDENKDTIDVAISRENGQFSFAAKKQHKYHIGVSKKEFTSSEKEITTYNKRPKEKIPVDMFIELTFDLLEEPDPLEPLSVEKLGDAEIQIIQIEHINYAYDSDKILPEATQILDKIINMVKQYPNLEVMIESHTDARGSDEYNLKLSARRATSAFNYVKSKGVDPKKIIYEGFGETQLLNHCDNEEECSEEEHALNRRSIIKVFRRGGYSARQNIRSQFYY